MDLVAVAGSKLPAYSVARNNSPHCRRALVDDSRVLDIQGNPKPVNVSPVSGDRPVAQVKPEEIDVVARELVESMLVVTASIADAVRDTGVSARVGVRKSPAHPIANRGPGDPGASRYLTVVKARFIQAKNFSDGIARMHAYSIRRVRRGVSGFTT
jgi:hypothetical protein